MNRNLVGSILEFCTLIMKGYTCNATIVGRVEKDDRSGLSYYGARHLAPWMARRTSPDSAGAVDGLNLYAYAGSNPL